MVVILRAARVILAKPARFLVLIFITSDKPREKAAAHLACRLAQKVSKQIARDEKKGVLDELFFRTRAWDYFKTKDLDYERSTWPTRNCSGTSFII